MNGKICCAIAMALLGTVYACNTSVTEVNITYDDNAGSLQTDPLNRAYQSFFPAGLVGNTVTVNPYTTKAIPKIVYGGVTRSRESVSNNTVNINGGEVGAVEGGASESGAATHNTVIFNNGVAGEWVTGGYSGSNSAAGNSVHFNGGTIQFDVGGGLSKTGSAIHNTVNVGGGANFGEYSKLSGGDCIISCHDVFTGNTLNLRTQNITVAGLKNFQYLNFHLSDTVRANDVIVTVARVKSIITGSDDTKTGIANIDKGVIGISMRGNNSSLEVGDQVILIRAVALSGTMNSFEILPDSTRHYEFNVQQIDNDLVATVTGRPSPLD
jgi:hypothetical protein